jgi:hypothetical protein
MLVTSRTPGAKLSSRMRWLLVLGLWSCGSKEAAPPPPPPSPVEVRLPQPVIELPKQQSFKLLEPGAGERSVLRYAIATTDIATRIEMKLTQRRMHDGIWAEPNVLPPITTGFAMAVGDAGKVRGRALPGSIDGKITADAASYLSAWKGSEDRPFTVAFDARGQLGALVFDDDAATDRSRDPVDDLTQRLLSIVVPVPEEAVGVGASWKVVTALAQRPVVVKQTATYTLLDRTPTTWKIRIEIRRVAEAQIIDDSTELVALVRHYEGTLEISPDRALPTGSLIAESSMHLRITPKAGPVVERLLEDKGAVGLTLGH